MKYFTIRELSKSSTANLKGIDNTPNEEQVENMTALITEVLDPIRERWGSAIKVNSGFRSEALNAEIKGVANSQHKTGEAADITTRMIGSNIVLFDLIRTMQSDGEIDFDQLIDEKKGSWIHISYKRNGKNRRQILWL